MSKYNIFSRKKSENCIYCKKYLDAEVEICAIIPIVYSIWKIYEAQWEWFIGKQFIHFYI